MSDSHESVKEFDYDIALSFAGSDRSLAQELAELLENEGVRVSYDLHARAELWGKDLYQHLQTVYRERAQYCVIILSEAYAGSLWTRHELKQAQARAFISNKESTSCRFAGTILRFPELMRLSATLTFARTALLKCGI